MDKMNQIMNEILASKQLSDEALKEFLQLREMSIEAEKTISYLQEQNKSLQEELKNIKATSLLNESKYINLVEREKLIQLKEISLEVNTLKKELEIKENSKQDIFNLVSMIFRNVETKKHICWNTWVQTVEKDQYNNIYYSDQYRNINEVTLVD